MTNGNDDDYGDYDDLDDVNNYSCGDDCDDDNE